jgi:glycosyltransferase involved in cell wall biosynthesis
VRYSILTPTLARPTLVKTCESVNEQSSSDWEHLVAVDVPLIVNPEARSIIESIPKDSRRRFVRCGLRHNDYGNTCRHNLWDIAKGDYILYLDDDNFLAHPDALASLDKVVEDWAIFPMQRMGERFYCNPPEWGKTDTANFLIRREHARWPNIRSEIGSFGMNSAYCADWKLVESLKNRTCQALPELEPVVVMERSNRGK